MKRPFVIQFEQLSLGVHNYEFSIDKALFERFGNETILDANVEVEILLDKSANMMDLGMVFKGTLTIPCDRCNERLDLNINEKERLFVKYGQVEHEEMDELLVLGEKEHEINLEQFFYETICLLIPARNIHPEKECDPEVLAFLSNNKEVEKEKDPRWQKLKDIHN